MSIQEFVFLSWKTGDSTTGSTHNIKEKEEGDFLISNSSGTITVGIDEIEQLKEALDLVKSKVELRNYTERKG